MPDPSPTIRFACRLSLDDYLALNEARGRLGLFGRFARPARYLIWYLIFLVVVALNIWPYFDGGPIYWPGLLVPEIAVPLLCILAFPFVWDLLWNHVVLRWYFKRNAAAQNDIVVDIDDDGVRWTLGQTEGRWGWSAVAHRAVIGDRAFLFVDKLQGIILPKNSLVAGDWDQFLDLARRKVA